ncbi:MAG: Cof-type HAD-IIB family hydrolase [Tetragenococcus sp.]|nr:Cof-type HAD-IIB family hydrolase [Tetragenococcus sp.]
MIKAIAVDMDGTFLNSNNDYNRARFEQLFSELLKRNIKFIVASGNQYAQLRSFFPNKGQEITFVSENGALIFEKNQLIQKTIFDQTTVHEVLELLLDLPFPVGIILCGVSQAYLLKREPEEFKKFAQKYYYQLTELDSFSFLPKDNFVKFALQVPEGKVEELVRFINQQFDGKVVAVSSGHDSVDLIIPHVHKGKALQKLLEKWSIDHRELLAFGDGNNDLEMLALAGENYAMKNGSKEVLERAHSIAPSNDDEGVLTVIESLLFGQN